MMQTVMAPRRPLALERWRQESASRRGVVLAVTLVCMALVSFALSSMAEKWITAHRQLQRRQQQLQADCLVQSAVRRGQAQWAAQADYRGERWHVGADQWQAPFDAVATIRVDAGSARQSPVLHVVVQLPAKQPVVVRRSQVPLVRSQANARVDS